MTARLNPEPRFEESDGHGRAFVDLTEITGGVRLVASGEIDLSTAGRLRAALAEALGRSDVVEVDLNDVGFMDSTGLGALVEAQVGKRNGQVLRVTAASPQTRRLLELTGLAEVFELVDLRE